MCKTQKIEDSRLTHRTKMTEYAFTTELWEITAAYNNYSVGLLRQAG